MRDKLRALIDQLRLHGMAEVLDAELARGEREALPAAGLLDAPARPGSRGRRRERSPGLSSRAGASAVAVVARQLPLRPPARREQRHRSRPWPAWTSCDGPTMSCSSASPAPAKPAWRSGCCARPASMAIAAASTTRKSCSTNFTPRSRTAPPPG